jgi:hypothetical protein
VLQIDTLLAFAIGLSYAGSARDAAVREPSVSANPGLAAANIAAGLFFYPWGIYYFTVWPSWEAFHWLAFTDRFTGAPVASLLVPIFVMSMAVALNLGFALGHRWIHRGRDAFRRRVMWAAYATVLLVLALNISPVLWVGTWTAYHAPGHAGATPLVRAAFLPYFLGSALVFIAGLVGAGQWLKRLATGQSARGT